MGEPGGCRQPEARAGLCEACCLSVFPLVFVFKPSEPRPLYVQRNICGEEVRWGVFVPRDVPEALTSEALQWLNRSQFYFLTASQVRALPRRPAAVPRGGIAAGTGAGLWKDCSPGRRPVFAVPPAGLRGCSWVRTEGWPPFLTVTSYLLCLHGSSLTAPTDLSFQSLLTFSSKSPEEKLTPTSKQVRGAAPGRLRGSLHRQGLSERSRERARLAWPDTELPPSSPAAS